MSEHSIVRHTKNVFHAAFDKNSWWKKVLTIITEILIIVFAVWLNMRLESTKNTTMTRNQIESELDE